VIRRDLGASTIATLSRLLHDSIAHALEHRPEAVETRCSSDVALIGRGPTGSWVDVNDLTLDYGERGREAVFSPGRRTEGGAAPPVKAELAN
jgi:predicted solute-binding protein